MKPNIISIINHKGGVGKTTTTINLAAYLAIKGYKVLVIDVEGSSNSTKTLMKNQNFMSDLTAYELIMERTTTPIGEQVRSCKPRLEDYIKTRPLEGYNNISVDVIPSADKIEEANIILVQSIIREVALKKSLEHHKKSLSKYDFVLIDCPPTLSLLTLNAFVACNLLLVPVDAGSYSLEGIACLMKTLQKCKDTFTCNARLFGIFCTMHQGSQIIYQHAYELLKEIAGDTFIETTVRQSTHIKQSAFNYMSVAEHAPDSIGAADYNKLTDEILERLKNDGEI